MKKEEKMTVKEIAKAIGGATIRARHLTFDRNDRVALETKKFDDMIMAAADGFEKKYADLLEQAEKFTYTVKVLVENDCPSALGGLEKGIEWLREHRDESVDSSFLGYYMYGYCQDIYKSEIRIAREAAGLTQQQFSATFGIPIDTVKSWDVGRRRPDKLKERLIIEKLEQMKEN